MDNTETLDTLKIEDNEFAVCLHCGQELRKASEERKEILNKLEEKIETDVGTLKELLKSNISIDANLHEREAKMDEELEKRQSKLDLESSKMLATMQRIEKSVDANKETQQAIKSLENKVKAKIAVEDKRISLLKSRSTSE